MIDESSPPPFFLTVPCNARIRVCNQPTIAAASAGRQWRGPGASGRHWQGEDDDGDGGDDDDGWMLNASRWRLEPQAKKLYHSLPLPPGGQLTNEAKHQNFPVPRGVDGSRTIEVYPLVLDVKDLAWAQR